MRIDYAYAVLPIGHALIGETAKGTCFVALAENRQLPPELIRSYYADAELHAKPEIAGKYTLTAMLDAQKQLPIDWEPLRYATPLTQRVWQALAAIPYGKTISYGELAECIGVPRAVRAVGTACGKNPIALMIPCHRVLGSNGTLNGYRWGTSIKKALLAHEASEMKVTKRAA